MKNKKILSKISKPIFIYIKFFTLIFLFYEEISFLSFEKFNFLDNINTQQEFNLHNSYFLRNGILLSDINVPFTDYSFTISYYNFLMFLITLFIGFACYFHCLKGFRIFYLEKKYSFYSLLFPFHTIFISVLNFKFFNSIYSVGYQQEFIEFLYYLIFIFDTQEKIKLTKLKKI